MQKTLTVVLTALLVAAAACACSGNGETAADEDLGLVDAADGRAETHIAPTDTADFWDFQGQDGADGGFMECDPGEGCFMDLCTDNGQCLSGFCVEHLGEGRCTTMCQEECPTGWSCQEVSWAFPDILFVCLSNFANLCKPCATSQDCSGVGATQDVCVEYGDDGSFCGGACGPEIACPDGWECAEATNTEGGQSMQCVRTDGTCPCSAKSVALSLATACEKTNDSGTCEGKRVCTDSGLTECDAAAPSIETCDGIDNDCDGDLDEETCDDGNLCTDDACVDGECQFVPNTVPCDDGNQCTIDDKCGEGVCAGVPGGCDCQGDDDCAWYEDGDLCNGTLYCNLEEFPYQCEVIPDSPIACPEPEGTGATCLMATCDPESGECGFAPDPANDGAPCDDDDACTVGETCSGGQCLGGTPANCNDGNECTDDWCDPATGCAHGNANKECQDGDVCTVGDLCVDSQCQPGAPLDCDDDNVCTDDSCDPATGCLHAANTLPCDDGTACTVGDLCANKACKPGTPLDCDDENPCTDDSCDPVEGCLNVANALPCDDEDACTVGDLCSGGTCVPGEPADCDDDNLCTTDSCNPATGCQSTANTLACDDGNACTEGDVCANKSCKAGTPADCDDDNVCTTDSCNPATGCQNVANASSCDDGNPCTLADKCVGGECLAGGPLDCDDNNVCTDDSCVATQQGTPKCIHEPNTAPCGDGHVCSEGQCTCVPDCEGKVCGPDGCGGFCSEGGLPLCEKQKGVCEGATKTENLCQGGQWAPCAKANYFYNDNAFQEAPETLCDLLDNDCDGQVDEELGELTCGLGACLHTVAKCVAGQLQVCDPLEGKSDEICDGIDNDCNGLADDGLGSTSCGLGPCFHSQPNCVEGAPAVCDPFLGASDEKLDGIDNDCDGQTDEGFPVAGTILITELMINPDCVVDAEGEWVELYNTTDEAWDLNGWALKDAGTDNITIDNGGPLLIEAHGYLVLGRNPDTQANGNVPLDYAYEPTKFTLGNSSAGDEVILVGPGNVEVDKVIYGSAGGFPTQAGGSSMSLNPAAYDHEANDLGSNWFQANASIPNGCGDKGTPGAANL
jgi:hypothetical protein